ncbi:type VI secretion system Vgr family protein, partial [Xanthomonas oryzae pv. oryzicola]|nr:type VI secretion system Vgr family protein [Xanthomonas oryzae pv. oryzicola]
ALAQSQDGTGGYQQLRLDDTPGQGRAQLSTTQHASSLTLGHLKGGHDNLREGERGYGADLSTQAYGAVRAGQGL